MWAEGFSSLQPPDGDLVGKPKKPVAAQSAPPTLWTRFEKRDRYYESQPLSNAYGRPQEPA